MQAFIAVNDFADFHQNESRVSAATVIAEAEISSLAPENEIPNVIGPDSAAL